MMHSLFACLGEVAQNSEVSQAVTELGLKPRSLFLVLCLFCSLETGSELCGEASGIAWRDIRCTEAVHEALDSPIQRQMRTWWLKRMKWVG